MLEKGISQLSHELQRHPVKHARCTTLWWYSATAYGNNQNRNCSIFWPRRREGGYFCTVIIRRKDGQRIQIWKWEHNNKLHCWDSAYTFVYQTTGNFCRFLCLRVNQYWEECFVLFVLNVDSHFWTIILWGDFAFQD